MRKIGWVRALSAAPAALLALGHAASANGIGHPDPDQIGFQVGVTEIARDIHDFYNYELFPIITVISLFVMVLLGICIFRFNEKVHPVP